MYAVRKVEERNLNGFKDPKGVDRIDLPPAFQVPAEILEVFEFHDPTQLLLNIGA